MPTDIPIISVEHANYVAGGRVILTDACWNIRKGDRWAVLGPNGAGKTTLLRIAGGYLWPNDGGNIKRLGKELVDLRELRRSIGWVANTQNVKIPPSEKSIDTVVSGAIAQLGLTFHRGFEPEPAHYDRANALLKTLQCTTLCEKPFGVLSQGEQQAVLVARAAMAEPMLIVLDEPCAGMDPGARERFLDLLGTMLDADRATSVVMVTHHIEEVLPQIDQVLIVRDGRIAKTGTRAELFTVEEVSSLYGASVQSVEVSNDRYWPIW